MCLVRLVCLSASAISNVCNSYQIKHLTLVYTLSLPLTLLISFFPYSKLSNVCPKRNRCGSIASVIFTQNNVTDPNSQTLALTLILNVTLSLILSLTIIPTLIVLVTPRRTRRILPTPRFWALVPQFVSSNSNFWLCSCKSK